MKKAIIVSTVMVLYAQILFGQCPQYDLQPPHLSDIILKCSVVQDVSTTILTYRYSMTNGASSTGCINEIDIDISLPLGSMQLSNTCLTDYPRYVDRSPLSFDSSVKVIPVGIPKLPSFKGFTSAWSADFSMEGFVGWFRAISDYRLPPGVTLDSIIMTSHGLPGLRRFVISPSYNPKPAVEVTPKNEDSVRRFVPEPSEEEEEAFQHLVDSIKVKGITIGPTAPSLNFVAIIWIDTLLSYKHQAVSLGWLRDRKEDQKDEDDEEKEDGVVAKLDKRLEKARAELLKGDSIKARKELKKFVKKVEKLYKESDEEEGKNKPEKVVITSEGFALLKYNAEYLIDRLPKKQKEGKE
jgi:nucleotide-binding universal stress UspA family protein